MASRCGLFLVRDMQDALTRTLAGISPSPIPILSTDNPCRPSWKSSFLRSTIQSNLDGREPDIRLSFSSGQEHTTSISLLMLRGYTIYLVIPDPTDQGRNHRGRQECSVGIPTYWTLIQESQVNICAQYGTHRVQQD